MRRVLLTMFLVVFALPAGAEWVVDSVKDRMTNRTTIFISVSAKEADHGVSASLVVGCLNGTARARVELSKPMTRGRLATNYRFDEGPQIPDFMEVFSDPNSVPFITTPISQFSSKKRFRFQILPTGSSPHFWDFDITGLGKVLPRIQC